MIVNFLMFSCVFYALLAVGFIYVILIEKLLELDDD